MRPLWRDIYRVIGSYLDAPYAMDADAPFTPDDYRPWAEFEKGNFQAANQDGSMLAAIDYMLSHPEFSLSEFLGVQNGVFDEQQLRRTLEIAREVAFPDAPPVPVPEALTLDPSGLLDRTPERVF
jgi:hypothetical protein